MSLGENFKDSVPARPLANRRYGLGTRLQRLDTSNAVWKGSQRSWLSSSSPLTTFTKRHDLCSEVMRPSGDGSSGRWIEADAKPMAGVEAPSYVSGGSAGHGSLDDPWTRLPIVAATALCAWLALLTICGILLGRMVPAAPGSSAIDARLVEMPGAGSTTQGITAAPGDRGSAADKSAAGAPAVASRMKANEDSGATAQPTHAVVYPRPVGRSTRSQEPRGDEFTSAKKLPAAAAESTKRTLRRYIPAANLTDSGVVLRANTGATAVSPRNARLTGSAAAGSVARLEQAGAPGTRGVKYGGGGGSGPRPIYAPVPGIPDDLRDEVMQATAVVRFHVAPNGTATVALLTPTGFTALDQLILGTLSNWRFQPATRSGAPVESDAEVHLKITVQ